MPKKDRCDTCEAMDKNGNPTEEEKSMGVPGGGGAEGAAEKCYLIGIFRNHSPPPRRQQFWKVSPENFFDNAGTIRKSRANFFPPP